MAAIRPIPAAAAWTRGLGGRAPPPHPPGPVAAPAELIEKQKSSLFAVGETGPFSLFAYSSGLSSARGSTTMGSSAGASTVSSAQPQSQV